MADYLVTGGCGFIGAHLVAALVRGGHGVRVLDDLSTGRAERCDPAAELVVGSVTDPELALGALRGMDGCFHLAAVASVPRCNRDLVASHQVNVGGIVNLLAAARDLGGRAPLVYASSAAVYGVAEGVASERSPTVPISHYGCDKLACEHHGLAAVESCGIASVGLRFFNVYGPGQDPTSPYSGVISIFAAAATAGEPIRIHGDGRQTRDFVFVADVVQAQLRAMRHLERLVARGERLARVYNVCTGAGTTIGELAEAVMTAAGRLSEVSFGPRRGGDVRYSIGCPEVAAAELGFAAATPLARGLRELVRGGGVAAMGEFPAVPPRPRREGRPAIPAREPALAGAGGGAVGTRGRASTARPDVSSRGRPWSVA